ncbi:MAG: alpha/beta hydrolase [Calditrichaeota bacterium]|nr:alpha/beta hydrolase [Calditrichota bacterium]MCB9368336.1 alpha/beta hydrolase [Calditrichota bacterium]
MRQSLTLEFEEYSLAAEMLLRGESVSDPAIVLLHDALGCMATWKEFPERLFEATGLDVVMFDRRGHGVSSPLSDEKRTSAYLEEDARRLPEILDRLGVRRAILVGHSDGGSIALVAAALYPERVASVVSIAAHVLLEEITIEGVKHTVATAGETRLLERLRKYHGEKTERLYSVWHETWLNPAHREWNLFSYLPKIVCPVLVMQGELDEYGSREQVERIVRGVGGSARSVMFAGVGHAPQRECLGDVVGEICEHCAA